MIKKVLLIAAIILFIILTFVTDFGLYLLITVIMAFVTWLLTRTGQRKAREVIAQVGLAMIVVPLILMLLVFLIKFYLHPESIDELTTETIDSMIAYVTNKLPYVILSDFAGAIVGGLIGAFQRPQRRRRR